MHIPFARASRVCIVGGAKKKGALLGDRIEGKESRPSEEYHTGEAELLVLPVVAGASGPPHREPAVVSEILDHHEGC